MKIAQIGAFDYENYGDILFPIVLKDQMCRRIPGLHIDLFSPLGGTMPFDGRPVYPVRTLEKMTQTVGYDAYVIGGGDLIRFDGSFAVHENYEVNETNADLWYKPIALANKYGIKIILNAPGVPFPITGENAQIASKALDTASYLAVRGPGSAANLSYAGVTKQIRVVPDSVFLAGTLYSVKERNECFKYLKEEQTLPERYILFQFNGYDGSVALDNYEAILKQWEAKRGCKVILMPIGYVHDDLKFLHQIDQDGAFQVIEKKLGLMETMTLIEHADCFIGTSFHGALTAILYGVPILPINMAHTNKMMELCGMTGILDSICNTTEELKQKMPVSVAPDRKAAMIAAAGRHMDRLADCLQGKTVEEKLHDTELELCEARIENSQLKVSQSRLENTERTYFAQLNAANQSLDETRAALNSIQNARLWKCTAPLRDLLNFFKRGTDNQTTKNAASKRSRAQKASAENSGAEDETSKPEGENDRRLPCYEENVDFSGYKTDIKTLALYLPQFHEMKENNEWWGEGFTEWVNVKKGRPRFEGHYQPRVPDDDFGYYDLSKLETLKKQIALAKQHGIYGFAIYYYWFSGKRLLEKPMDMLLEHKEIEFPFCAIWANENWTRTWDGKQNDILIEQEYSETDAETFILDLKKYLEDKRYIRVHGKPVIGLYAPRAIPNLEKVLNTWRKTAKKCGIGEILIWTCASDATASELGIEDFVDGEYEFPPRCKGYVGCEKKPDDGCAYDYVDLVESERHFDATKNKIPTYRGSMMEWDNSARKKTAYNCWSGFSVEKFYLWNRINVGYTRRHMDSENRFLFVNAWNEWGEGTYLEPDKKYGYANINALSRAIFDLPYKEPDEEFDVKITEELAVQSKNEEENRKHLENLKKLEKQQRQNIRLVGCGVPASLMTGWDDRLKKDIRIAVQVHVFYPELIGEVTDKLKNIPYPFDLYITTNERCKATYLKDYLKNYCTAVHYTVEVTSNKGRDVVPFLKQMKPVIGDYDYVCHLHTKKSLHSSMGDTWRGYLYENLLGSSDIVREIFYILEQNKTVGLVFPQTFHVVSGFVEWGSNKLLAEWLMRKMGMDDQNLPSDDIFFPAGDMFWGRTTAIKDVFDVEYTEADFPNEHDQTDGTLMHAIERLWLYVAQTNGYTYQLTRSLLDNCPLDEPKQ